MLVEHFPPRRKISRNWLQRLNPIWAIFGNEDDGPYGDDKWRAGRAKTWKLAVIWWFRNPFHNLFFYVIGIADHPRTFYSTKLWGEQPGWSFHYTPTPTLRIPLPFVSHKGKVNFYAGWRPYGAFGFKLNRAKD